MLSFRRGPVAPACQNDLQPWPHQDSALHPVSRPVQFWRPATPASSKSPHESDVDPNETRSSAPEIPGGTHAWDRRFSQWAPQRPASESKAPDAGEKQYSTDQTECLMERCRQAKGYDGIEHDGNRDPNEYPVSQPLLFGPNDKNHCSNPDQVSQEHVRDRRPGRKKRKKQQQAGSGGRYFGNGVLHGFTNRE